MKDVTDTYAEFVSQRQRPLLRLAMVLTGDARRAEDIVGDVLGRAFERWDRIGAMDQPNAYVRRMVVNEFLSWRRRFARITLTDQVSLIELLEPDHADAHAERDALIAQLSQLPPKQRAALVLRFYEGLSDAEIAAMLGCSQSTVRSNTSRALATLRIGLDEQRTFQPLTEES